VKEVKKDVFLENRHKKTQKSPKRRVERFITTKEIGIVVKEV
jgi:hypothetical protein